MRAYPAGQELQHQDHSGTAASVAGFVFIVAFVFIATLYVWWGCRIEVEANSIAVLIRKTGKDLPSGAIIAPDSSYKGVQLAVLPEGRYFRNPYSWDWKIVPITAIPAGSVGVQTRLYGKDIPADALAKGRLFATADEKGMLRDVLRPGNYRINPYAYHIKPCTAIEIPAGFVGVVTELAGSEPTDKEVFVVKEGEKGVQPNVLQPGTRYVNPYAQRIDLMDIRSQRHEMFGDHALRFPTSDGFDMWVQLIVEWAVDARRAPEVLVRLGEMGETEESNAILQKIVVPAIRGYGRIIGSQYSAPEYIAGASRIVFQSNLFDRVRALCASKGVEIKSVMVADIDPPQEIAQPIREREIAKEELARNEAQIEQAKADQDLAMNTAMIDLEKKRVEIETTKLQALIAASNSMTVALVNQAQKLSVAKTDLEASKLEATAIRARGKAQADVALLGHKAEAEALKKSVAAFGSGHDLAEYELVRTLGGKIETVFTTDDSALGKVLDPSAASAAKGGK